MSILASSSEGWLISHSDFIRNIYSEVLDEDRTLKRAGFREAFFKIDGPFVRDSQARAILSDGRKRRKRKRPSSTAGETSTTSKEIEHLTTCLNTIKHSGDWFAPVTKEELLENNKEARNAAETFYSTIPLSKIGFQGGNTTSKSIITCLEGEKYLIPPNSAFSCQDVRSTASDNPECSIFKNYDFILLDPPWWNKFVRRKVSVNKEKGYQMMENSELTNIPLMDFLKVDGLVGVWTTNAPSHIAFIKETLFPAWDIQYVSTWFWLKVCRSGEPTCSFSAENGKQPYERLIFGAKIGRKHINPDDNKCIISIPSSIHSHKPPLTEVLQQYLPDNPECMELFARYLLPGWMSVGNQVLSLQNINLYNVKNIID